MNYHLHRKCGVDVEINLSKDEQNNTKYEILDRITEVLQKELSSDYTNDIIMHYNGYGKVSHQS